MSSIGKRLLDLARANLNALLDRAGEADLEQFSDDELQAELELRKARKRREDEIRVRREAAERAARQRAAERSQQEGRARARAAAVPAVDEKRRLAELYALLETPYGAPLDEVKKNFRRLVRRHHPDLHASVPAEQKSAHETTARLTTAYNELERILGQRAR